MSTFAFVKVVKVHFNTSVHCDAVFYIEVIPVLLKQLKYSFNHSLYCAVHV